MCRPVRVDTAAGIRKGRFVTGVAADGPQLIAAHVPAR